MTIWRIPVMLLRPLRLQVAGAPDAMVRTALDGYQTTFNNQQHVNTVTLGYCYDALNRLTYKFDSAPNCQDPSSAVATFSYDAGGAAANAVGRLTLAEAADSVHGRMPLTHQNFLMRAQPALALLMEQWVY